ncbi:adenylate/guanylate cyclase domain-containing protein [Smaragdicoccus niigatensis]|uniref:adenylate/guanylate cyclase domain-containing protein n=1 Tax=Smaragdicoccus niigatensis TaxID=359359 RepID=UPI00036D4A14|nr:adenylate/guanylate cyclase domain-containing protein [Smaragdicoccus niigatensis]
MRLGIPRLADAPLGSRLLGAPTDPLNRQRIRVQIVATALLVAANGIGAAIAIVLVLFVLPTPSIFTPAWQTMNFVVLPVYVLGAFVIAGSVGTRLGLATNRWHYEGRTPNAEESARSLALPRRLTILQGLFWLAATVLYIVAAAKIDPSAIPKLFFAIGFTGIAVSAFSYQLAEFSFRAVAAVVIETGAVDRGRLPQVTSRVRAAWILGTGIPLASILLVALSNLSHPTTVPQLARAAGGLALLSLVIGFGLTTLTVRLMVQPIRSVTQAMQRIAEGDLTTHLSVYDGTELGQLQGGFNRMAEGLRERERIHDLFGRHVGRDVAAEAVKRNPTLGGEERQVAAFFLDLIGSTRLAATRPPEEVVEILNRVFDVVVAEIDAHGGFVNKFEGDAALAVFGAPLEIEDPAGQALAAGRVIARRLKAEVAEISVGIGVSYGTAVAGNIGARDRFEYTVIGDPINEAARLCDLSKQYDSLLVASEATLSAASAEEAANWELGESVLLRGRVDETRLALPR